MIVERRRHGVGRLSARLVVGAAVVMITTAQAPRPLPAETLSLHGDAAAPDVSGVWVRDGTSPASASAEGWLPWPPPLTPKYAEIWRQRQAAAAAGKRSDDPVQSCLPPGMPRFDTGMTGPLLIIQTPGRVMLYRDGMPVRRVWLDGRPFPAAKDLEEFSNGSAMGHYDGGDLLVEVRGIRDQPIDATGVPHSDQLVVQERFHRVDVKTLRVTVTMTDPVAFSRPLMTSVIYGAGNSRAWEPKEWLCQPGTNYHPDAFVR